MSIYFQYPAINDYPNLNYSPQTAEADAIKIKNEYSINEEEMKELKDFLALKPV